MKIIYAILFLWILPTGYANKARAGEEPGRGTKRYTISGNIRDKAPVKNCWEQPFISKNNIQEPLPIFTGFIP